MDKNERVEKKKAELMRSFETLQPEKLKVAEDLIGQAAFMSVELEDLSEIISKEGMTETYTNGANQSGRKVSSNAKMYGVMISKYNSIVAQLMKHVPAHVETEDEKLMQREKNAIQKEVETDNFRAAVNFVDEAINNSPADIRDQIDKIWTETFFDYRETARLIKERGLYKEIP